MLAMFTTRPQPRASMSGRTARVQRKADNTFTSNMRASNASLVFRKGALSAMPALFTRTETGKRAWASVKVFTTAASSVTSQTTARESGIEAETSSRAPRSRPKSVMRAPCAASARAQAAPMPRDPPVTTACLPERKCSPGTAQNPLQLLAALNIGLGPFQGVVSLLGGGPQCPVRIGQVRSREAAKIGAPGRNDAVHMVDLVDIPDSHGGDMRLVADEVRRSEEHT